MVCLPCQRFWLILPTVFCLLSVVNHILCMPQSLYTDTNDLPESLSVLFERMTAKSKKSLEDRDSFRFAPKVEDFEKCAEGSSFCENIKDYPRDHINDMFDKEALKQQFETKSEVEISPATYEDESRSKSNTLCQSVKKTIYPNVVRNDSLTGKLMEYSIKMGMEVEECLNSAESCSTVKDLPDGFKAVCKQKYIYTDLPMTNSNGARAIQKYLLPSGCVCMMKMDRSNFLPENPDLLLFSDQLTKP